MVGDIYLGIYSAPQTKTCTGGPVATQSMLLVDENELLLSSSNVSSSSTKVKNIDINTGDVSGYSTDY